MCKPWHLFRTLFSTSTAASVSFLNQIRQTLRRASVGLVFFFFGIAPSLPPLREASEPAPSAIELARKLLTADPALDLEAVRAHIRASIARPEPGPVDTGTGHAKSQQF